MIRIILAPMDAASAASAVRARPAVNRPPLTVWLFMICSWVLGWWMTFDGLHDRLFGDYVRINGQLGPWTGLARAAGLEPNQLAFAFVAFGLGLIGASFGVFLRRPWGYAASLVITAACLLYLGFGTPMAMLCLVFLLLRPTRAYLVPPLAA
jgi:hypothetical protein